MASGLGGGDPADEEPMVDDVTARAWLARKGFAEGDLRSAIKNNGFFPMLVASGVGELANDRVVVACRVRVPARGLPAPQRIHVHRISLDDVTEAQMERASAASTGVRCRGAAGA